VSPKSCDYRGISRLNQPYFLAITFAPSDFRHANPLTRVNPRAVNVSEAYAAAANPSTVMKATSTSGLHQLLPASLRSVLKDVLRSPESSKIFYFLLLNLAYMFVQLMWGVWTNSLGLISDAIHMAFDCVALGVGLFASVMATWESDATFTYGYVWRQMWIRNPSNMCLTCIAPSLLKLLAGSDIVRIREWCFPDSDLDIHHCRGIAENVSRLWFRAVNIAEWNLDALQSKSPSNHEHEAVAPRQCRRSGRQLVGNVRNRPPPSPRTCTP
jgi:hypothetical protein